MSCNFRSSFSCLLLLHNRIGAVHISPPRRGCFSISTMSWDSRKPKSVLCSCGASGLAWVWGDRAFWLYLQELEKWIMVHSLALSSACAYALQLADFPPKQSGCIQIACEEWCLAVLIPKPCWPSVMGNFSWPRPKVCQEVLPMISGMKRCLPVCWPCWVFWCK